MADGDRPPEFTLDDANALRFAIGESVRAIRRQETTPDGQLETLGFLVRDGAQSIATLARRRRVRHQSMSGTIAELEAQGLVTRAPDPVDARGLLVSVTDAGTALILDSRVSRSSRILAAAESALTAEERATLIAATTALQKLTTALHGEADAEA